MVPPRTAEPPLDAGPVLVIQNDERVPMGRIGELLTDVDLLRADTNTDALANLLTEHDQGRAKLPRALVVLGGSLNAYDDQNAPWFPHLCELIRRCIEADIKVLGICLGHQLLARATGGHVTLNALGGPELGIIDLHWVADLPHTADLSRLADRIAGTPVAYADHGDIVSVLPEGACLWASSPLCPQMFSFGSAIGVQFHPEVTEEIIRVWLENRTDLTDLGQDPEQIVRSYRTHVDQLDTTCRHLIDWLTS